MFMRALFLVVTLIEAFVVVTPYVVGRYAEQMAYSWADYISPSNGYSVKIEQYERGWWGSTVVWSLQFSSPAFNEVDGDSVPALLAQTNRPLRIMTEIEHGPLLSRDGVTLGWARLHGYLENHNQLVFAKYLGSSVPRNELFAFDGEIDLRGNQRIIGGIPAMREQMSSVQPIQLDFRGWSFEVKASYADKTVSFTSQMPKLQIKHNQLPVFSMSGLQWSGTGEFSEGWNWIGSSRFTVDEMRVLSDSSRLLVRDAIMVGDSHFDIDNTITARGTYNIGEIAVDDDRLTDFEMALLFERISLDAIHKYMNMANQIALDSEDPLQLQMELSALFQHLLPEVLPRSPAISLSSLGFKWNGQDFDFKGQARFNGNDFAKPAHFYSPDFWLKRLNVIASLQVDKELAEEVAEFIFNDQISKALAENSKVDEEQIQQMATVQAGSALSLLTRQRQLISTPRGYKASFVLESGQARLNGELVSLLQ